MNLERLLASMLSVVLAACSTTPNTGPSNTEDLARFVLVIRELPDGQLTHTWQNAEGFDLPSYRFPPGPYSIPAGVMLAASQERDCHEEYLACHRDCRSSSLPPSHRHIPRGSVRHDSYCWEKCKQPYLDCERLKELQPREFTAIDNALDWLKRNRKTVLVGSLVVIAGVTFVVVSAGAGLLVLAPAVLVASAATPGGQP
jgi:hypothetical protein